MRFAENVKRRELIKIRAVRLSVLFLKNPAEKVCGIDFALVKAAYFLSFPNARNFIKERGKSRWKT